MLLDAGEGYSTSLQRFDIVQQSHGVSPEAGKAGNDHLFKLFLSGIGEELYQPGLFLPLPPLMPSSE